MFPNKVVAPNPNPNACNVPNPPIPLVSLPTVLKNFKARQIKIANYEFRKERRKLEKILEEKISPFRDKIIQELKEKYPNGHCDPEGKGFNLYDEDCYTDKELDEATEKLVEEEKRLIPLIPGYEELLEKIRRTLLG